MHNEGNQFVRYCDEMLLKAEHMPEVKNQFVPTKHDAAIIAAPMASHALFYQVRDAYKGQGKPVFLAKGGISDIKHDFEDQVFGSHEIIKLLRRSPDQDDSVPALHRFWWVMARFNEVGQEVAIKKVQKFFEKFLLKGQERNVSNAWYRGRDDGFLKPTGAGKVIFLGVPERIAKQLNEQNLKVEDEKVIKSNVIVRKNTFNPIFKDESILEEIKLEEEPIKVAETSNESEVAVQLLLETMGTMQGEIRGLKDYMDLRLPEIVRTEMKILNTLVGEIQPELAGLTPEQLNQIMSMIKIMKQAYGK
jgi:hypothetical protein